MENQYWIDRWNNDQIVFHEGRANAMLIGHVNRLGLVAAARVFVPLCGKARDISWLRERGFRVVGSELSRKAIDDLFTDLGETPKITRAGSLERHAGRDIDIFVGDIFDLERDTLGPVDAIYDRAALVALPRDLRTRYAAHLSRITQQAPQLLITFDYDQSEMDGPPFSVPGSTVEELYDTDYTIESLEQTRVEGKLKGQCEALECAWLLRPK